MAKAICVPQEAIAIWFRQHLSKSILTIMHACLTIYLPILHGARHKLEGRAYAGCTPSINIVVASPEGIRSNVTNGKSKSRGATLKKRIRAKSEDREIPHYDRGDYSAVAMQPSD